MQVTVGYSREHTGGTRWSKCDVTVEEVDFRRYLASRDIDPDIVVRPHLVFRWMEAEGEAYLTMHQLGESLVSSDEAADTVNNIRKIQDDIFTKIKESVK